MNACKNGNHNLKMVYIDQRLWGIQNIVRWCQDCGGIVVDSDVDGRIQAGKIMPMIFPNYLKSLT